MATIPCAVRWCAAVVTAERAAKGWRHCDVHRKGPHGPKLHPEPLLPGEDVTAAVECKTCDGSGECQDCDGEGEHHCEHRNCYDTHDCRTCRGTGDCRDCNGKGDKADPINAYLKWALNIDAPKPLPALEWPWDEAS